jgi:hypothetical protein
MKTTLETTSHLLGWPLSKQQKIINVDEYVEKLDPCALLVGM